MSDNVTAIKGFADLFSPDSDAFTHMEAVARETFSRYGFTELRTPILERTELFCRGIGTETDVVQKEMYTFPDRKGRSLTLRPEATAGVMRAYIESGRSGDAVTKLFTIGPMFRYERPQKGRMRQFHQINCECLGPSEPYADAELVTMAMRFLEALGLKDLSLQLNSLGCPTCRPAYRETLRKWLSELDESALCEDCRRRMVTNPLRVLDSKNPEVQALLNDAPALGDYLDEESREHFAGLCKLLESAGIAYTVNQRLVRGLDYYNRTVFEWVTNSLGSQGTVCAGGRYDGLVEQLGGRAAPAVGFAMGLERLVLLVQAVNPEFKADPVVDIYLVASGADTQSAAMALAERLRDELPGVKLMTNHGGGNFKKQFARADKWGARVAVVLGESEVANGTAVVKDLRSGEQTAVAQDSVAAHLRTLLG